MKRNALIRLKFHSKRHLQTVFKALKPEARKPPTRRSRATLEMEDKSLVLKIEAKDTVALRATANAYLRWIDCTKKVLEVINVGNFHLGET